MKTKTTSGDSSIIHPIKSSVLLFYIYADTHYYAYGNLKYFIETAVRENDGADYIFILQQVHNKAINEKEFPPLPKSNAFYYQHENRCFDIGTAAWFIEKYTFGPPWPERQGSSKKEIEQRRFNLTQYKYFIFMNASIRGPFFPPYYFQFLSDHEKDFKQAFPWYNVFTSHINERVKLVGCTISCLPAFHIQSYFITTDNIGLAALIKEDIGVFTCFPTLSDAIVACELAISALMLRVNYSITSVFTRYDTLEFSKTTKYDCPINGSPYADGILDGTSLEPYDVVFVKANNKTGTYNAQNRALLYQKWMEQATMTNRTSW